MKNESTFIKVSRYPISGNTCLEICSSTTKEGLMELTIDIVNDDFDVEIGDPDFSYVQDDDFIQDYIKDYNLGHPIGILGVKNYKQYPLYMFDPKQIEKYNSLEE